MGVQQLFIGHWLIFSLIWSNELSLLYILIHIHITYHLKMTLYHDNSAEAAFEQPSTSVQTAVHASHHRTVLHTQRKVLSDTMKKHPVDLNS